MKKTFRLIYKIITGIIALIIIFLVNDFYMNRGYYSLNVVNSNDFRGAHFATLCEKKIKVNYNITKTNNNNYLLEIDNNTTLPYYYIGYNNSNTIDYDDDTYFFQYASYKEIQFPYENTAIEYGFSCGTGLGNISINPYESFRTEITYDQLLGKFHEINELVVPHNYEDTILYDLINLKKIVTQSIKHPYEHQYFLENLSDTDSLPIRFYIRVNSVFKDESYNVYSNVLNISYLDLVRKQMEMEEEWRRVLDADLQDL